MDKAHAQAQETRKRNAEARRAGREAQAAERERDKALVLNALRAVLQDPEATSAQCLYAVAVLEHMQCYQFAPYGVRYTGDVDIASFRAALQEREETENK